MSYVATKLNHISSEQNLTKPGWQANLILGYIHKDNQTVLARRDHFGPLSVQKPFYPEGKNTCHTYLIHPPGGIVGGDRIDIEVRCGANSCALITTPGAAKFYRSNERAAVQEQRLFLDKSSCLEWFPQEIIIFNESRALSKTVVELSDESIFMGWEIVCLGRPASNDRFKSGSFIQSFEIWRAQSPMFIDRIRVRDDDRQLHAQWGLQGKSAFGVMCVTQVSAEIVSQLREHLDSFSFPQTSYGVTLLDNLLVCRGLSDFAYSVKDLFIKIWMFLRPYLLNKEACIPRIWAT